MSDIWLYDSLIQDNNHFTYPTAPTYSPNGLVLNSTGLLNHTLPDKYAIEFEITNRPNVPSNQHCDGWYWEYIRMWLWQNNGVIQKGTSWTEVTNSAPNFNTNDIVRLEYDNDTNTAKYYVNDVLKYTITGVTQNKEFRLWKQGTVRVTFKNLKIREL